MNFLCKLLIWSFLCCLLATRVQAQENERGEAVFCDTQAQIEQFAAYYEGGLDGRNHFCAPPSNSVHFCFSLGGGI